jgi:putative hydrolase of the HAD superfamily
MPTAARRIDAVIFDLDDTLIDWSKPAIAWTDYLKAKTDNVRNYLVSHGHSVPPSKEFFAIFDQTVRSAWEHAKESWIIPSLGDLMCRALAELGLEIGRLSMDELLAAYGWSPYPGVVAYPQAIPLLAELRRRGYRLGLVTNSLIPMAMRDVELREYDLIKYLDARLSSGDVGVLKPHPAIYHRVLEMLQTSPERAVFIGDRPANDIAGANEAGLISVLFDAPHLAFDLDGVVPDYTITSLDQLLPILDELEREVAYNGLLR